MGITQPIWPLCTISLFINFSPFVKCLWLVTKTRSAVGFNQYRQEPRSNFYIGRLNYHHPGFITTIKYSRLTFFSSKIFSKWFSLRKHLRTLLTLFCNFLVWKECKFYWWLFLLGSKILYGYQHSSSSDSTFRCNNL